MHMESLKVLRIPKTILNSTKLQNSYFVTSKLTTKLQYLKQYGISLRTDIYTYRVENRIPRNNPSSVCSQLNFNSSIQNNPMEKGFFFFSVNDVKKLDSYILKELDLLHTIQKINSK